MLFLAKMATAAMSFPFPPERGRFPAIFPHAPLRLALVFIAIRRYLNRDMPDALVEGRAEDY